MSWFESIAKLTSLGSKAARPGSLARLHNARKEHLSQFFTSSDLAFFLWKIVTPAIDKAREKNPGHRISILDNSVGTGRLLQFADPEKHRIAGVDVHQPSIDALNDAAEKAGFMYDFVCSGMENVQLKNFDITLINPPFSIPLSSPNLKDYSCCSFGRFGPHTSAISHFYALAQALDAAKIVAAILPTSAVQTVQDDHDMNKRLAAVFDLPSNAFKDEGISVKTSVLVFDSIKNKTGKIYQEKISNITDIPNYVPSLILKEDRWNQPHIETNGIDSSEPFITLPVTGNKIVRVSHDSRKIILSYKCGLTQAKVANAILKNPVNPSSGITYHRYAQDMKYTGQGRLDVEVFIMQENPMAYFEKLIDDIKKAGGIPEVDPGIINYIKKRTKQYELQKTPVRHSVWMSGSMVGRNSEIVAGIARNNHAAIKDDWGSPIIKKGQHVSFRRVEKDGITQLQYKIGKETYHIDESKLHERFKVAEGNAKNGWSVVSEGRLKAFPEHALSLRKQAESLGIDKILSWKDYQFNDLIEAKMDPKGAIIGWKMGLGKARLAISLCLIGGERNLIVVEPQLMDEMIVELEGLNINQDKWQVIRKAEDVQSLKKINLISYNRLRMPIDNTNKRKTIARLLRRRISTLVADEGHLLRNSHTQQSRALIMISPKHRYLLSGTPIDNYPRDAQGLTSYVFGDGTAIQPYGTHRSFLESRFINSTNYAKRGVDAFRDHYIVLEWVTNEFKENNNKGAKREIPKVKDVARFRKYLAPLIKRRLHEEPEVSQYIKTPKAVINPVKYSEWDDEHLEYYLKIADGFRSWYIREKEKADQKGKALNLVAVLARIQAVEFAGNLPQRSKKGPAVYQGGLTSKQENALDDLETLVEDGHKTIFYAHSPELLDLFHSELNKRGIHSTLFHGKLPIMERTKRLNEDFRFGDSSILLASYGVTQKGLNIWQADRVYRFQRDWKSTTEDQANARVLRPQQTKTVEIDTRHLPGSIDDYKGQMVEFKRSAAAAGLDWGEQISDEMEFEHIDTILEKFCEELKLLRGIVDQSLRDSLKLAA